MTGPAAPFTYSTAGLAVFGIATGIRPELIIAGLIGCWWAISYQDPQPLSKRLAAYGVSAFAATWGAPPIAQGLPGMPWWPDGVTADLIVLPVALGLGLVAYKVLGPAIMKAVSQRLEQTP